MLTKKEFSRKRLALIDRLRRDHEKTVSTRIVGTEIIACTNYVTGDAWPSGAYLAKKLGLGIRTVKRAIKKLGYDEKYAPDNYFHISRSGRSNRYRPNFALIEAARLPLEEPIAANSIGAKNDSDRCQIGTSNGAKKDPLSLIKNPITPLLRAASNESEGLRGGLSDTQKAPVATDWRQSRDAFRAARAALKAGLDDDERL